MANSIVQTGRPGFGDAGELKKAQAGDPLALARLFGDPNLFRSPAFKIDALTDDANAFKVWDSSDALNNSNAVQAGFASPPLLFPANTLTAVQALALVANDDTIGLIGVRALVLGSATAPTLVSAFEQLVRFRATSASGVVTRVAAGSSPGTTIAQQAADTGRYTLGFPACAAIDFVGGGVDPNTNTPTSESVLVGPRSLNPAGSGEVYTMDLATPTQEEVVNSGVLYVTLRASVDNLEFIRSTQHQADVADTLLKFGINSSPTPDSLKLEVTGIASAELRWNVGVWVGDPQPIAFRTQV